VYSSNAVYAPSFPLLTLEGTRVPCSQLQRIQKAVTGPARFLRLLERGGSSKENPTVLTPTQTLRAGALDGHMNTNTKISTFFLVPGGRYMVTEGEALCIWDLNQRSILTRPIIVQSLNRMYEFNCLFLACPTSNYNAFRVVTSGRSLGEDEVTVR